VRHTTALMLLAGQVMNSIPVLLLIQVTITTGIAYPLTVTGVINRVRRRLGTMMTAAIG
jgi:hypothetical protein